MQSCRYPLDNRGASGQRQVMRGNSTDLWAMALMLTATALVVMTGVDGPIMAAMTDAKPADWLGFAGGLVGGLMTILAAAIAFGLTRRQVNMQAEELRAFADERVGRSLTLLSVVSYANDEIGRTIQSTMDTVSKYTQAEMPHSLIRSTLPTFFSVMGYSELWRLPKPIAGSVLRVDSTIQAFNWWMETEAGARLDRKRRLEAHVLLQAVADAQLDLAGELLRNPYGR